MRKGSPAPLSRVVIWTMGEMLQIQVGQCGNRVGTRFWQSLCAEHGLNDSGNSVSVDPVRAYGRKVFFDESKEGQHSPRTVLVDLEPSALDSIRAGPCGRLFPPDQYVFDTCGTGNLFARGHYTVGREFSEVVLDRVRCMAEKADCLHGFQFVHSLSGGTGSGLGVLLLSKLREEYSTPISSTYTLFPSLRVSDSITEVYNTVLSMNHIIENCDIVTMFDNETLSALAHRKLSIESPTYADLNHLISDSMVHITCPKRFHGASNMRKVAVNLIPFYRMHFLKVAQAPLSARDGKSERLSVSQIINDLFDFNNFMKRTKSIVDSHFHGFTTSVVFRGDVSSYEVEHGLSTFIRHSQDFPDKWLPNPLFSSICSVPAVDRAVSASLLLNSSFTTSTLASMCEKFTAMFRKKAFLHWYTAEGMDEMEFSEAHSNVSDLISEYTMTAACGSEHDFDEMEGE